MPNAVNLAGCTPGPIDVKPTITVDPVVVHPNDLVKLTITFTEANPCPGDHLDVTMPPQFADLGDFSFPFVDPDGNVLGTATIKSGQLTVVLGNPVQGLSSLTLTGSYNQRISRDASQGENTLNFPTSGGNVPVPITVLPCEGSCSALPSQPSKFGKLVGDHLEMVGQTPAFDEPTPYTFIEKLTSPGQEFICPVDVTARSYTGKDANGQPTGGRAEAVIITSCSPTQIEGSSQTSRANSFARLFWNVQVTSDTVTGWTDELSITTTKTYTTTETVERQTGIGTGVGTTITTTPPTTTTTPPAPPTSSTSTTTTSTPTSSSTPTPTPSATSSGQLLAFTGSSMLPVMIAAFALLVLGAALLLAARRGSRS